MSTYTDKNLDTNINIVSETSEEIFDDTLRCKIISSQMLESYKCMICLELAPIVNINFPCNAIDKTTGKPKCMSTCCLKCTRDILNLSNVKISAIKCPSCRKDFTNEINLVTKTFKDSQKELYTLNVVAMKIIDDVLSYIINDIKKEHNVLIKPIICQRCDMHFKDISSLHHHMRGDTIIDIIPCPMSPIYCRSCKIMKTRKDFIRFSNDNLSISIKYTQITERFPSLDEYKIKNIIETYINLEMSKPTKTRKDFTSNQLSEIIEVIKQYIDYEYCNDCLDYSSIRTVKKHQQERKKW